MSIDRTRLLGIAFVAGATVLWSSAGLFVRAIDLDVWQTLGWRAFFAALSLFLILLVQHGRRVGRVLGTLGSWGWLAIPVSAVSMYGYVAALTMTTVANVMTMYATLPFLAVGIAYLWMGEKPSRRVIVASLASFAGILVMTAGAVRPADLLGIFLAFMMTAGFAFLLILARREPGMSMASINGLAALVCFLACLPLMPAGLPSLEQFVLLAVFGVTTNALAYLFFMHGGRFIPPGEAGLIGLLDVVLGPLWVWLAFSETPGTAALIGSAIVLAATGWYLSSNLPRRRAAPLA